MHSIYCELAPLVSEMDIFKPKKLLNYICPVSDERALLIDKLFFIPFERFLWRYSTGSQKEAFWSSADPVYAKDFRAFKVTVNLLIKENAGKWGLIKNILHKKKSDIRGFFHDRNKT